MNPEQKQQKQITGTLRQILYAGVIITGFLLVGLASLVFQFLRNDPRDAEKALVQARLNNLALVRTEEENLLKGYSWVDKNAGVVRVPLERAMDLTQTELGQKPVARTGIQVEPPPAVK